MPYFVCRIAAEDGRVFSQSFLAPSNAECRKHFEEKGLCVLSIKRDWKKIRIPLLPFEKRVKDTDFIMFNKEFVALIKAGYPILKSIVIIISRMKSVSLKELLVKIEDDVRSGKSLSEAFAPYEKDFSKVYLASLMAGERSGNLAGTIGRYIQYAKVIAQTKARIRAALMYPTLLIIFSFILLGILLNFILPSFTRFYASFEADLPVVTQILMSVSTFLRRNFPFILAFLLVLLLIVFRYRKRESVRIFVDRIKLLVPYGKLIWMESAISLFCRSLSLLLSGGISLLSSIGVASQSVPNRYILDRMKGVPNDIKNGENLSDSLEKAYAFPPLALDMIRIGETSANLDGMLTDVAEVFDESIQTRIDKLVSLIEPVIIILMGILVAGMLLSVYLPIFNIIRIAR